MSSAASPVLRLPGTHPKPKQDIKEKQTQVTVKITDHVALTEVDQYFHNPTNQRLEGYFLFPIPKGASIREFTMDINGKETKGELLESNKAREIYEGIVRKMKDPALLEFYKSDLFKVRIFPIEPNSDQHIRIQYREVLPANAGTYEYTYALNHDKHAAQPAGSFSIQVDVNAQTPLKSVFCPTHDAEILRKSRWAATLGYESTDEEPMPEFKVYFNSASSLLGVSLHNYRETGEKGYFQLTLSPGLSEPEEQISKDVTFVLDASGSMRGEKMDQAKAALLACVDRMADGDCFDIVRFSTEAETLFGGLESVNDETRGKARQYIRELDAIGGTNLEDALDLALKPKPKEGRPHSVVLITDGKPTIGLTGESQLLSKVRQANPENVRIFTFGVGSELNTHLLDLITAETRAYRSYVLPGERIDHKVADFYEKISAPVLTDLKVRLVGDVRIADVFPKSLPDLFKGGSVSILGRYMGNGPVTVVLEGQANGKDKVYEYSLDFAAQEERYSFVPALWGARAVGHLLDQVRLHGESTEMKDEIVRLAKQHGVVTPYTSFLIIEDESQQVAANRLPARNQLLNNRVASDLSFRNSNSVQFQTGMNQRSGRSSVDASHTTQTLNAASNIAQLRGTRSDLVYRDVNGRQQQLTGGIRKPARPRLLQ